MTDIKLIEMLEQYYTAQRDVVTYMRWAMEGYKRGGDDIAWRYLFDWCEAKDDRAALWKKFKHNYPRAMMLKEGYYP